MKILVINCGGSSVKYQLIEMPEEETLARGYVERLGKEDAVVHHQVTGKEEHLLTRPVPDHKTGIELCLQCLLDPDTGAINDVSAIDAVGHRVVHAGEKYTGSVIIDEDVIAALEECIELAPLHNPPNLAGIRICRELMPDIPHVCVFDNGFHVGLPKPAATYAIPYEYYEKYGIRRYGFHGITFRYMTQRASELLGRPLEELRIVSLMLGSGTTANALKYGKSVDVSTGFTPTEGLVQSTRCGDIDPLVITYLMRKENLSPDDIDRILNKESGWLGISGVSNDLREIAEAARQGNERAALAIDTFVYRCRKYIGAYAAAMGGIDVLIFSGGIGENAPEIRRQICSGLEFLGIVVDDEKNENDEAEKNIGASSVDILVIPTNEELVIARDTFELVSGSRQPGQ